MYFLGIYAYGKKQIIIPRIPNTLRETVITGLITEKIRPIPRGQH